MLSAANHLCISPPSKKTLPSASHRAIKDKDALLTTSGAFSFCTKFEAPAVLLAAGAFSLEKTMLQLLLFSLLLFGAMAYAQAPETTQRTSQTGELLIHGPVDKVFSLFTPKGELLWIPTWKYTPLYPASGETEQDMVFRTDDGATTWTLAHYDPPNRSVYVLMNADLVARIEVQCRAESANQTNMRITYTWTALTDKGREQFAKFTDAEHQAKMARWKTWLDDYSKKAGWMK